MGATAAIALTEDGAGPPGLLWPACAPALPPARDGHVLCVRLGRLQVSVLVVQSPGQVSEAGHWLRRSVPDERSGPFLLRFFLLTIHF